MPVLSRLSGATGFKEILAAVKVNHLAFDLNAGVPVSPLFQADPAEPMLLPSLIQAVSHSVRRAQIAPLVIVGCVVSVVNDLWRLLSGHQKIGDAVRLVGNAPVCDQAVSLVVETPSNVSGFGLASADKPNQITRTRAVFQYFSNGFGYKVRSHVELPLSVVRGLGTAIPSAPILSRGISL